MMLTDSDGNFGISASQPDGTKAAVLEIVNTDGTVRDDSVIVK
jgi:hypothetical protein